jgi:2-polyprenyl-3-methyl-5-hydroxy-6-metoxy-1,4-benzoquinol methylase
MQINSATSWNDLYKLTPLHQFTWFEAIPVPSLKLITSIQLPATASIIDVGGGPGILARQLLASGYNNITIVDFAFQAIQRGKAQLGEYASHVNWMQDDILSIQSTAQFDLWHDRACLHYLADRKQQKQYVDIAASLVKQGGYIVVGEFAGVAPSQSTGLPVHRYSEASLSNLFGERFELVSSFERVHISPRHRLLPFVYCCLRKR